ncbi:MAG: S9 family peptidase [Flavobacteriales bacterium]|nr:S9 family peptidase [Flavobacteriales bacterium]MEB2342468.1 S9 family peptidase [Flavobacteriia bacterium]
MKTFPSALALLTGIALTSACGTSEKPPETAAMQVPPRIPVEEFFKNPEKAGLRISPDGNYFSYRAPWHGRMNIFVQPVAGGAPLQVTRDTVRDIYGYFWKGDRLLYARDINGDENMIVFSASMDGNDVKALTPEHGVRAGVLDDLHNIPGMEESVIVQMNQRNPEVFDPYLVNISTGTIKPLYDNKENFEGWITDHTGTIRMATKTDGTDQVLYYRATDKEPFKEYLRTGFKDSFNPLFFTFDNKNLYASSNLNGRDKTAIVEWDIAGKKELREVYANPDYDVDGLDYSRKRQVPTMVTWTGEKSERKILDPLTQTLYDTLGKKMQGYEYWVYGENDNEDKFMVWAGNDRMPGKYWYYDLASGSLKEMAVPYPDLKEEELAEMKPISYQSRDGLTIHGYLTLPKGREAKSLPVVINPHGGPWARDDWGYNPEVQMLANRGYAVLQMNFRGSTGYGRKFWEASFKQWGKAMQDDVTDGVGWLVQQGIADPKRVAIYGGSYGGYATLAGITFTPDLYACAVDYVGVSNLFTFMNTVPPYWEPFKKMMYEMVGDPKKDSLLMREASPVFHADQIKCPLFIAQGANDPRVNKDESDQMVAALKARGITVEYMVKDDEGHGFHNEENRMDFYNAMDKFLDAHIGSGYQAVAAATAQ